MSELAHWRNVAESIAAEAGRLALSGFRSGTAIEKKGLIDLVTRFDRECEASICEGLARACPDHAIVGEEGQPRGRGEWVWYVDPIDGTTNFAHGHPFFAISLGLVEGDEPRVGVVLAPALGVCWSAHQGGGATRNGERIRVSDRRELIDCLCATGFAYDRTHAADDNLAEHDRFVKSTRGVRRCGAASLDLALTAEGTYDAYWEQCLAPWDIAAGMLLVTEAGGRTTDYLGAPARPRGGQIVASNGLVHEDVLATIAAARRGRGLVPGGRPRA